jgi:adenosylmethionine-8-amino-7-oxononanoate aminotransferase
MPSQRNHLQHLWFPFTYSQDTLDYPPVVIERGKGVYLYDQKGKKYIDAISSWWVNTLGHNNPEISRAVRDQVKKLEHVLMAGFVSEPALEVSRQLTEFLPSRLTRYFYSDNGSTAVEVALKMALQYWQLKGKSGKKEFVSLSGAYHGDTLGAMSVGMIPDYHSLFHRLFKKQHYTDSPYCYRCPVGKKKETCSAECMDSLESILQGKSEKIAACIFEPLVQGAAGMRIYPSRVLKRIFSLCEKYDVLTIADEVATGFGRTGKRFACEHVRKTPDIMCVAKGLTGGYLPMSVTAVKESIFQEFCGDHLSGKIFYHGHSFTGNPLSAAAASAALTIMKRDNIPESLQEITAYFQNRLQEFSSLQAVGDVRSIGLIGAIELVADRTTKRKFPAKLRIPFRIARRAVEYGVLIRPLGNVLYFMPPYIITKSEIDTVFSITRQAIEDVVNA